MLHFLDAWQEKTKQGLIHLLEEVSLTDELLFIKEELAKIAEELLQNQGFETKIAISKELLSFLHNAATSLFSQRRYEEAECAFCFLVFLESDQYAFWVGLGHAAFGNNNYSVATKAYAMATLLNRASLWPHVWAANVFEADEEYSSTLQALEDALEVYNNNKNQYDIDLKNELSRRVLETKLKLRL